MIDSLRNEGVFILHRIYGMFSYAEPIGLNYIEREIPNLMFFLENFVSLGMIHIAEFDIFEIIGDNINKIGMSIWRL